LLPVVNLEKRPRIVFRKKGEPITTITNIGMANGGNAERELMIANEGNACRQQDPNGPIK
jgi:hypothetical protein